MKKSLLTLSLLSCSILVTNAQQTKAIEGQPLRTPAQHVERVNASHMAPTTLATSRETAVYTGSAREMVSAARRVRAAESTLSSLYGYPEASYFWGMSASWGGYSVPILQTSAFVPNTFYNYASYDKEQDVTFDWSLTMSSGSVLTLDQDENGNAVSTDHWGYYPAPVLTVKQGEETATYNYGERCIRTNKVGYWYVGTDSLQSLSHASYALGAYSGFNNLTEKYKTNSDFKGKKVVGFAELFDKPASATYVTSISMIGWIDSENAADALGENELTAEIYTIDAEGNLSEEPYATATATKDDYELVSAQNGNIGLTFQFVEEDMLMGTVSAPIMLPEQDFIIKFTGFENVDGDITLPFCSAYPEAGHSYVILEDGSLSTIGYTNQPNVPQCNVHISLNAALAVCQLRDETAKFMAPVDGGWVYYEETDENGETKQWNDIMLDSNVQLNDKDENEPWVIEGPDWITGYDMDDQYQSKYWVTILCLDAEALPEGVTGRVGEVTVSAYGRKATFTVTQGEDPTSGIKATTVSNNAQKTLYNIAGQRVGNGYKGLVIKNGKKVVLK